MEKVKNKKKILPTIFFVIFNIVFLIVGIFYSLFYNEINSLMSIRKVQENIYTMDYSVNYYFDDFLKVGASSDAELKNFIMKKLVHGLPIDFDLPDYGCSTFNFDTDEGNKSYARNLDIAYAPIMIVKTNPVGSYSSISMVNLSALGFSEEYLPNSFLNKSLLLACPYIPFDGVNEMGVAISVNMVNGKDINQQTDKINLTTTTLIRLVLDKAKNVEEAVALIQKYDLTDSTGGPYHFQIADKNGKSVVIEYCNNEIQIINQQGNFQCLTNHTLNDLETDYTVQFNQTYERYNIIEQKLNDRNGVLSNEDAFNLLKTVNLNWEGGGTLYSSIYDLSNFKLNLMYKCDTNDILSFTNDKQNFSTFNLYGLIFVVILLVPNILFAIKYKKNEKLYGKENKLYITREILKYLCLLLLIVNVPVITIGFKFNFAPTVMILSMVLLIIAYLSVFIFYNKSLFKKDIILSLILNVVFIVFGLFLLSSLVTLFAIISIVLNIFISKKHSF